MTLGILDQTRKMEDSSYGESVRLSNDCRAKPARFVINIDGERKDYQAKWGFNPDTDDYSKFTQWLNDSTIKKSESLFWFVIRTMAVRFPEKHIEIRNGLAKRHRLEFDLILSQMKEEWEWIGTVSYQNMVRLDNSLSNPRNRVIKNKDSYRIIRK